MPCRPIRWVALLDGPLAGERANDSIKLPDGTLPLSRRVPDDPGMIERHEYRITEPGKAVWVRTLGTERSKMW